MTPESHDRERQTAFQLRNRENENAEEFGNRLAPLQGLVLPFA